MLSEPQLYRSILDRHSVRRYNRAALGEPVLARVAEIASAVRPLIPTNRFEVLLRNVGPGQDLVADLGGYGRVVNPPHYLVPYLLGDVHPLTDLGYRVEQIAVRLAGMGLGSCFIGCLGREAAVRDRFRLPAGAHIAALLIFGRPSVTLGGRAVNTLLHIGTGAENKLPAERIFFQDTFDSPAAPPAKLARLIEAARNAPSAVNAQPWRFLWRNGELYLFVTRRNRRYGSEANQAYNLHDGGLAMANVSLALEALGLEGRWLMLEDDAAAIPEHPADLLPLARLVRFNS